MMSLKVATKAEDVCEPGDLVARTAMPEPTNTTLAVPNERLDNNFSPSCTMTTDASRPLTLPAGGG